VEKKLVASNFLGASVMWTATLLALLCTSLVSADTGSSSSDPCFADGSNTFHVWFDPYSSETGYFKFMECGDTVMPVLALEKGVTYTFDQNDASNWYHPLGFARDPEGDDELDHTYRRDGASITEDQYEYAFSLEREERLDASGAESADEDEGEDEDEDDDDEGGDEADDEAEGEDEAEDEDGEGADEAEDEDGEGADEAEDEAEDEADDEDESDRRLQAAVGFAIELAVPDAGDGDLFYFCDIHNRMAGRIKVYDGGVPVHAPDSPPLGFDYETPSDYDASCGTYGVGDYTRASGLCASDAFVCTEGDETAAQAAFGECMYALDCHMNYNMRSTLADADPVATFIHQMIPHHQNAVNMAKLLMKQAPEAADLIDGTCSLTTH